jgi:GT2 family glycosyltransferase
VPRALGRHLRASSERPHVALPSPEITISVVSHGHGPLVARLLADIAAQVHGDVEVLLTLNVPEAVHPPALPPGAVQVIANAQARGYGANHNAAFRRARGRLFCVLNPDLELARDPFPPLVAALGDARIGVAAPLVTDVAGRIEDSARRFPTVRSLAARAVLGARPLDYSPADAPFFPDWVAGMFMLFRRETYAALGGFDERYFLYYEDVDLCRRMRARGLEVVVVPRASVVHLARRASHRNLRHLRWHLGSALRYLAGPRQQLAPLPLTAPHA